MIGSLICLYFGTRAYPWWTAIIVSGLASLIVAARNQSLATSLNVPMPWPDIASDTAGITSAGLAAYAFGRAGRAAYMRIKAGKPQEPAS